MLKIGRVIGIRSYIGEILRDEHLSHLIVHILDPAALATSSQALVSFWPEGDEEAGNVTRAPSRYLRNTPTV